ncbi:phosphatidate cytidylyltransferase [Raphidocelis subcapitata]|uniref:Phosphatidate cytidylyltransferase n=1 Tax=Raphidocelis subcapitata TaxID=307507 RepID=A0A2V0NNE9_9CHLO|nr:phosphatidate cytidylyltransferase [Raphidocelis subcapitata]|eukprot:GBF88739.1 phosphatidate cytidylyltransferase [Raphidocelis subcapitata]
MVLAGRVPLLPAPLPTRRGATSARRSRLPRAGAAHGRLSQPPTEARAADSQPQPLSAGGGAAAIAFPASSLGGAAAAAAAALTAPLPSIDGARAALHGAATAAKAAAAPAAAAAKKAVAAGDLAPRVASALVLGAAGAGVVAAGGLPFLAAATLLAFQASREYFGMVAARDAARGAEPAPPVVAAAATALCVGFAPAVALAGVKAGAALCVSSFALLALTVVASARPTFGQLTSAVFGLLYCGFLPCFWVQLRALPGPVAGAAPASVGLAATLAAVLCVVAADTGAYFAGRAVGRTKLTDISPKKTVEGAAAGAACSVAAALALRGLLGWPGGAAAAAGFGAVMFVSSIFGDLIESIIKREAGLKDSGNLIPGHGGLLDRFDSYMFSGAIAWVLATALP